MEGFIIRSILPGCGGTTTLSRGETLAVRWLHEPQPTLASQLPASVVGISTPYGTVSTRGVSVFVLALLEL